MKLGRHTVAGVALLVACFPLVGQTTGADAGVLNGSVQDEAGAPLAAVRVAYARQYALVGPPGRAMLAPGESATRGVTVTDQAGQFEITNLPAGQYRICVTVPDGPYLDPCKWGTGTILKVDAGAAVPLKLVLKRGVFLRVRINDPKGLLASEKVTALGGGRLIVGVRFGSGAFLGSEGVSPFPGGQEYRMVVPAGLPCSLWLFSRNVLLDDSSGARLTARGTLVPFQAKVGGDEIFTFTASGDLLP